MQSDWIEYYDSLPNEQVIQCMKEAHIGLLPSKFETYGYAVLEYQACGCPCITTDIRALTEINHDACGWICRIPHNEYGEAIYGSTTDDEKENVSNRLRDELTRVFRDVLEHTQLIEEKGKAALHRIQEEYSPEQYAEKLLKIYNRK